MIEGAPFGHSPGSYPHTMGKNSDNLTVQESNAMCVIGPKVENIINQQPI